MPATFRERIPRHYFLQFRQGAQHHAGPESDGLFNCVLNPLGKFRQVFFAAAKNHVAALDVCLRVFQFQPDAERFERVHLDQIAAADVHTAQHADNDWHRLKPTTEAPRHGEAQTMPLPLSRSCTSQWLR